MIEAICSCGAAMKAAEAEVNQSKPCQKCGAQTFYIAAEQLQSGAGAADFDAAINLNCVGSDGSKQRWQFYLGGVAQIEIGKLPDKHIVLTGSRVSRSHCRLERVDFGPSRWKIVDRQSTNGTIVNGQRVTEHELVDGDVIDIGGNELVFRLHAPAAESAAMAEPAPVVGGIRCPGCGRSYSKTTKICIPCGVDIRTGRSLITSQGIDENDLHVRAENTIKVISWLIPFGLYPIASEAFGTKRPYAIWTIFAITLLASIAYFVPLFQIGDEDGYSDYPPSANLMLWAGYPASDEVVRGLQGHLTPEEKKSTGDIRQFARDFADTLPVRYHSYQLITHAFLHGGIMHLAGNMVFLLVFGLRVNALIGNLKTAIIYPLLAVAAAGGQLFFTRHETMYPMLGASGAIMGLAGMYFVLFPVHRVYMAIWLRLGLLMGFRLAWQVWALRGFWVVLFYISFDILATALAARDGTAHWAHLGGFVAGMIVAFALLLSRQVDARGADILTRILGKHAWTLVGRPANEPAVA